MQVEGWYDYNHAAVPSTPPHKAPNLAPVQSGDIWRMDGRPLLARWTTDFDCGRETGWWYTTLDRPFDIAALKSKRRSEINKGLKNFDVHLVDPRDYAEDFYRVTVAAFAAYPAQYRPTVEHDSFIEGLEDMSRRIVYGAFSKETGALCAYAWLAREDGYLAFRVLKSDPAFERLGVNAATVHGIVTDCESDLRNGVYICDGERNILHQTAFPAYLEKYFGFRRAYCHVHIRYRPPFGIAVAMLYPFRRIIAKIPGPFRRVSAILRMEEARRTDR